MEAHNEATRPGVAENEDGPRRGGIRISNERHSAQRGQSGGRKDRLDEWLIGPHIPNIEAVGDPLRKRADGDVILRVGFQNIRGTDMNNGYIVAPQLDAMDYIGTDTQGMTESNKL